MAQVPEDFGFTKEDSDNMYNVVSEYFKRHPLTTPMGAAYAAELALAGYFAFKATQGNAKYNAIMAGQSVTNFDDVSTLKFVEIYNNLVVKYGGQYRNPHQPEGEHT